MRYYIKELNINSMQGGLVYKSECLVNDLINE